MTGNYTLVYYLVLKEWDLAGPDMRQGVKLASYKRASKGEFWATIGFTAVWFGAVRCAIENSKDKNAF